MNSSPHKHVKNIIGKYVPGEEKQAVLAYVDHQQGEIQKLEKELKEKVK